MLGTHSVTCRVVPMGTDNPPLKHHYIPRFLLAQWALNDGRLWRMLRPVPGKIATKCVAPAEIGYEAGLYSLPGLPAAEAQQVERHFMSPLDAMAADAHRMLLEGRVERMPQRERSAWSRFIMSLWFRTPDTLRDFKDAFAIALLAGDDGLERRFAEIRRDGQPEKLADMIAAMGPEFAEHAAMDLIRKMSDDPDNGLRLNNMHWSVIAADGGREFLISDAALQHSSDGVFTRSGWITIPIAPRHLFVAVSDPAVGATIRRLRRNDLVSRNNRAVVRRASIFVGASDLSQLRFVERHFGQEEHRTIVRGVAERYRTQMAEGE